jgi:hypothetical protein
MLAAVAAAVTEITQGVLVVLAEALMAFHKMEEVRRLVLQILVEVVAVDQPLVAQAVTVVLEYLLFLMLAPKKVRAEQLQQVVETQFTPLLHQAHSPHKEQTWHLHK